MIWIALAALIGFFYYREKFHMTFWNGFLLVFSKILSFFFTLGAIMALITSLTGVFNFSPTFYYGLLLTALSIASLRTANVLEKNKDQSLYEANQSTKLSTQSNYSVGASNNNQLDSGASIETSLAGVTFENRQVLVESVVEGEHIKLIREPNNIHDHNAIKVVLFEDKFGRNDLGYIKRELANQIAPLLDEANKPFIEGVISAKYTLKSEPSIFGLKVKFSLPNEQENDYEIIEKASNSNRDTMIDNIDSLSTTNNEFDQLNKVKKSIVLNFDPKLISDVPFEETQALVSLFFSTQGNRWANSTNWLTGLQVELWEGVRVQNGHVIGLSLSSNGLRGVIPAEISYLKELQYLLLYDNQLIGTIPPELGSLVSLKYLYLYENQLTGSLPPQMGGLVNLKELDIGNNNLNGFFPLTLINLSQLEYLNYAETNIAEPDDIRFQDWKDTVESWEGGEIINQEND